MHRSTNHTTDSKSRHDGHYKRNGNATKLWMTIKKKMEGIKAETKL